MFATIQGHEFDSTQYTKVSINGGHVAATCRYSNQQIPLSEAKRIAIALESHKFAEAVARILNGQYEQD